MRNRFKDKVAVVTGGSTGIGFSIAEDVIREGAKRVYITGRSESTLKAAAQSLGESATAQVSDVSKNEDLKQLANLIESDGERIDVLFVNAGIAEHNLIGETEDSQVDKIFDINVKGVFFTVQTLLPLLNDNSSIVLTASIVANKGVERFSLYNASKAAVRSFARSWANDLKTRNIRVNALSPGLTMTPIIKNGMKWNDDQIKELEEYAETAVPAGRMALPNDISPAALFLASNEAAYVNGIEMTVDGGFSQI